MKKFIIYLLFLISNISYSQKYYTQEQLQNAGFKKKTSEKIIKKFNGDVVAAFNQWAESGSGSLGKTSAKAAKKLGIDYAFVDSRLKEAKKVRGLMIAAALGGAATGIAQGMEEQSKIQAESLRKQNEILQNSSYGSSRRSFSNPSSSLNSNSVDYSNNYQNNESSYNYGNTNNYGNTSLIQSNINGGVDVYEVNEYGFEQKTGSLKNNLNGGVDINKVGDYGFEEKVGSYSNNLNGGVDINKVGDYGFEEKVGSYSKNINGGIDKNKVGDYGFEEKTGGFRKNLNGGYDEYILDSNGFEKIIKTYVKNLNGGYDVFKVNPNGLNTKIGTITKVPW